MKQYKFDFLVFIGRFQPFHCGHLSVIQEGLKQSQNVVVLCGTVDRARTVRNPWSFSERASMIRGALNDNEQSRVQLAPLTDSMYNDAAWVREVQTVVSKLVNDQGPSNKRIGLIGHSKDHSSYYLNLFPQWGAIEVDNYRALNATAIRERYFQGIDFFNQDNIVPPNVAELLRNFTNTEAAQLIKAEQAFIDKYQRAWEGAPYEPTFVTVDAVVIQSGHVLLVERKARPGKGQLALPGGFVKPNETLELACLRELKEETRLKIPVPVLKGSIKAREVFDDPHRSTRGRTITHAFYIELVPGKALPKVKGSSDASLSCWRPLSSLKSEELFEDHYYIIQRMAGLN